MGHSHSPTVRVAAEADGHQIQAMLAEAFGLGLPDSSAPPTVPLKDRWVLGDGDALQATALSTTSWQWFGGSPVGSGLVRGVAVSSTARGGGASRQLMSGVLEGQRADGLGLSTLYPSVPGAYRSVGYEYAGDHQVMTAPLAQFRRTPGPAPVRLPLEDLEQVRACYDRSAAARPAALGRDEAWWREKLLSDKTYLFGVHESGELTGYVAYSKKAAPGRDLPYYFDIEVSDAAWTTASAGLALLNLLASHAGLGLSLRWPGHAGDLWSRSLRGEAPRIAFAYPWMLRIVDVTRALTERGYPTHVTASVALTLTDDVLPSNAGPIRLDVEGGRGQVTPVADAALTLDVSALAALYTGYLSPAQLAGEGRLPGASSAELAALDRAFAAVRPLLAEMF